MILFSLHKCAPTRARTATLIFVHVFVYAGKGGNANLLQLLKRNSEVKKPLPVANLISQAAVDMETGQVGVFSLCVT